MMQPTGSGARWQIIRFPLVLALIIVMLVSMETTIDEVSEGVNMPLYYSSRLEETSKMHMEATKLFDLAERLANGDPKIALADVSTALDVLWSRVNVGKTKNYQSVMKDERFDLTFIPEMAAALPEFDAAVKKLVPGNKDSYTELHKLKDRFGPRLAILGDVAWTVRQQRMAELVQQNLANVSRLRDIQISFVILAALSLGFVVFELFTSQRLNRRLNSMIGEKQILLRTDALTGIANRARFEEHLAELSSMEKADYSVIYLDLDGFKRVNDTIGHAEGDILLRDVAAILLSSAGPEDTVSRFGGDEFAVLLSGSRMRAENFVQGACPRIANIHPGGQVNLSVSGSAGIAHSSDLVAGETRENLMRHADLALYAAKNAGRNCVVSFQRSMLEAQDNALAAEVLLPQAIANGEIKPEFQPIVSLDNTKVVMVEALVRWTHPQLGAVSADRIIEIAEKTGQIAPLTFAVLSKAIDMRKKMKASGLDIAVSVNLSPTLLSRPGFALEVVRILSQNDIVPGAIHFEVTEYAQIEAVDAAQHNLRDLQFAGIPIAVDDFGKAHSGVQRLMDLDFRYLKLDRHLIENIMSSSRCLQILTGLNSLAEAVGAEVISEGVETEEQLQIVRKAGIRNAQGFYFARPMAADALLAFLGSGVPGTKNVVRFTSGKSRP